jgi:putative oxidoreductase
MSLGKLTLRATLGSLFIGHGTQKLLGWFGGHGLEGTAGFFEGQLGLRPGKRHATAAGVTEVVGGGLLVLGALTPMATAMLTGTMVTAIRKVHGPNGPWITESGYEYNAVIIAALAALTDAGAGSPSVDENAFPWMKGSALAVGHLEPRDLDRPSGRVDDPVLSHQLVAALRRRDADETERCVITQGAVDDGIRPDGRRRVERRDLDNGAQGRRRDSNPRPPGSQPGALPAELRRPRAENVSRRSAAGERAAGAAARRCSTRRR